MKLLVVYGDEAYCLRLCECLKEMDAFCVEEPLFDASAAIARAKVAMPDIVIADMQLSGMEAMELLDSLRRECGAKTVACSSVHNESAALTAMQHGADYFENYRSQAEDKRRNRPLHRFVDGDTQHD